MYKRSNKFTSIPEVRDDLQSVANAARALKQSVDVLTRQTGNESDWAVTVGELSTYVNNAIANQNPVTQLDDAVLNGILDRAAAQADNLTQQLRDEAYIGLAKLQTALDNFKNGYEDTNAVVRGKISQIEASVSDTEAKIVSEQIARATDTQALAGRIDTVSAQTRGNIAAVNTDLYALAGPTGSIAARIDNVTTATPTSFAGRTTFIQSTAPTSRATNSYWVDLSSGTPVVKQWNGTTWTTRTATIGSVQPTSPVNGDLWFDTNAGLLKIYASGSMTWSTQAAFIQSRTPTVIAVGDVWVDTSLANTIKQWNGTAWVAINKNDNLLAFLLSSVTTESISKSDGDRTIGARITNLISVAPDGNSATINGQQLTTATRTSALADILNALAVQTTSGSAGGFYRLIASATPGDGAAAEFNVQVRASETSTDPLLNTFANAGMRIQAFSSGQSRVKFNADQFIIANSTNAATPFAVISGVGSVTQSADANVVIWNGTQFLAGGNSGSIATSADGDSWTYRGGLTGTTWGTTAVRCALWTGLQYIVGGDSGRIATSPDAVTWTYIGGLASTTWSTTRPVRGLATNGTTIVAVGDNGRAATSADGITWTYQTALSTAWGSTTSARALNWNGTQFVAVGINGKVATSPDGITWTNRTSLGLTAWGTTSAVRAIAWNGTTYLVVGDGGRAATSTDGITWTYRAGLRALASWSIANANAVIWTGTQFVVLGDTGTVATSVDGVTWTDQLSLSATGWGTTNGLSLATSGSIISAVGVLGKSATSPTNGTSWNYRDNQIAGQVIIPATNLKGNIDALTQIENLGLMSYVDQITSANAATFIGTAAIGNAYIADGAITTAKIGDAQITTAKIGSAQVDTLSIGANAVTVPVRFNYGTVGISGSTFTGSFTLPDAANVLLVVSVTLPNNDQYYLNDTATGVVSILGGSPTVYYPSSFSSYLNIYIDGTQVLYEQPPHSFGVILSATTSRYISTAGTKSFSVSITPAVIGSTSYPSLGSCPRNVTAFVLAAAR